MEGFFASVIATIVTMPLAAWLVVYMISYQLTRRKKASFRLAVDLSTLLFIAAVHFMIYEIWGRSVLWLIVLFILGAGAIFTIVHYKYREEIHFTKIIKGAWRFNFIVFMLGYFMLLIIGLAQRILEV
ncbi:DUF3397 domain-containing protein [Pseudalkalibacillus caeni]|uniref:DUF3397 domain-containing protein n=1 Tax=Exobacillus caeni TaxID=2574798 RepID=A0A5R9EVI3_9BACL|nr:DUF3397 domain-containing protein [Pseudalkalibacillus caeni]TLS35232.1 DUF3397 domain-containing protein [Pseudalkalibacillus caeni]